MKTETNNAKHMKRMPPVKIPRPCDCEAWPMCEHGSAHYANRKVGFTPGPWVVHPRNTKDALDAYSVWPTIEGLSRICTLMNERHEKANAKLISAAPDLLAACKNIRANWPNNLTDAMRQINDAIEKATGESI